MISWGFKHVRCNPDVAPRLTSGAYGDKVDVITPINILVKGGDEFWPIMEIKLMLLPQWTSCSEGVANFSVMMIMMWWCDDDDDDDDDDDGHDGCKCGGEHV